MNRHAFHVGSARVGLGMALAMALAATALAGPQSGGKPLGTLRVEAGVQDRVDAPMAVELPAGAWQGALKGEFIERPGLIETTGGRRVAVPAALDPPATPTGAGGSAHGPLLFILAGRTAAGAAREFELVALPPAPAASPSNAKPRVEVERSDAGMRLALDGLTVLRYSHLATKPPPLADAVYRRSGYIHPVHTPSGRIVTDNFPPESYHHKGLWMAWTNVVCEDRTLDFWNPTRRTGRVQFLKYEGTRGPEARGAFIARHVHLDLTQDPHLPVLDEVWETRLWATGGRKEGYFLFDLASTQRCAANQPLVLKRERYGGLAYRGPREWSAPGSAWAYGEAPAGPRPGNHAMITSEGHSLDDANGTNARWMLQTGKVDGAFVSFAILSHPDNPRHPEGIRLGMRGAPLVNISLPLDDELTLKPGKTYVFRYRFIVADGRLEPGAVDRAWLAFGAPPRAILTLR